jgi:hypothetical protein
MNTILIEKKNQPEKIPILTDDLGSIGVSQIIGIIFQMVVKKGGIGMKEESCGT